MAYDNKGRWVPSADITWKRDTAAEKQALRERLASTGLDWRHAGKYAFRTNHWGQLSEEERFGIIQYYDDQYDSGALADEMASGEDWGLDIQREGITYNSNWGAMEFFNAMTGGKVEGYEWKEGTHHDHRNPGELKDREMRQVVGTKIEDGKTWTKYVTREYPLDWKYYTYDDLYRATIDEIRSDPKYSNVNPQLEGSGGDIEYASQVRAMNKELRSWVDAAYGEAGITGAEAEAILDAEKVKQIESGKITNKHWGVSQSVKHDDHASGPIRNQGLQIQKYQPWNHFDPATGTRTKRNRLTGEILDTFVHKIPSQPTRMTVVGNKNDVNVDEGKFYSNTIGLEQKITDSMHVKPPSISKPNLSIRKVTPKRGPNIPESWSMKGGTS